MSFILGRLSPGSITLMRAGVKGHPENLRKFIHFGDRSIPFLCNHRQRFDNHPDGRWWWWCISNITQISQSRVMLLVYISEVPCSDVLVNVTVKLCASTHIHWILSKVGWLYSPIVGSKMPASYEAAGASHSDGSTPAPALVSPPPQLYNNSLLANWPSNRNWERPMSVGQW